MLDIFLVFCFLSLKKSNFEKTKCFVILLQIFCSWDITQILESQSFMTSWNTWVWNKRYVLLEWLGKERQSGNEIQPCYVILQKKKICQKIFQNMWHGVETSSRHFCVYNKSRKNSSGKQNFWNELISLVRHVIAEPSKHNKMCMQISTDSFKKRILETKNNLELVSRTYF